VYEAVAEGGITRFAAVFQSTDPGEVGPVRSVRPQDPDIVAPFKGITAFSGGVAPIVSAMSAVSEDFSDDAGTAAQAFRRSTDRFAPHNLYASASTLWSLAKAPYNQPPPDLFRYGRLQAGATVARAIDVPMSPAADVRWAWQAGAWHRSQDGVPFTVTGTGRVAPVNLIIEYVRTVNAGYNDVAGTPVPTSVVTGSGKAMLLRDGHAIRGTWSKPGQSDVTTYTTLTGDPLQLHPGRTWVELMPDTATVTVTP